MWKIYVILIVIKIHINNAVAKDIKSNNPYAAYNLRKHTRAYTVDQIAEPSSNFDQTQAKMIADYMNQYISNKTLEKPNTTNLVEINSNPIYMAVDPVTGNQIVLPNISQDLVTQEQHHYDINTVYPELAINFEEEPVSIINTPIEEPVQPQKFKIILKVPNNPIVEKINEFLGRKPKQQGTKQLLEELQIPNFKLNEYVYQLPKKPKIKYYYIPPNKVRKPKSTKITDQKPAETSYVKDDSILYYTGNINGIKNKPKTYVLKKITDTEYIDFLKHKQDEKFKRELMEKYKIITVPKITKNKNYKFVDSYPDFSIKQMNSILPYKSPNYDKSNLNRYKPGAYQRNKNYNKYSRPVFKNKYIPNQEQSMMNVTKYLPLGTTQMPSLNVQLKDNKNEQSEMKLSVVTESNESNNNNNNTYEHTTLYPTVVQEDSKSSSSKLQIAARIPVTTNKPKYNQNQNSKYTPHVSTTTEKYKAKGISTTKFPANHRHTYSISPEVSKSKNKAKITEAVFKINSDTGEEKVNGYNYEVPKEQLKLPTSTNRTRQSAHSDQIPKASQQFRETTVDVEKANVYILPHNIPDNKINLHGRDQNDVFNVSNQQNQNKQIINEPDLSFDDWRPIIMNKTEYVKEFYALEKDTREETTESSNQYHQLNRRPITFDSKPPDTSDNDSEFSQNNQGFIFKKQQSVLNNVGHTFRGGYKNEEFNQTNNNNQNNEENDYKIEIDNADDYTEKLENYYKQYINQNHTLLDVESDSQEYNENTNTENYSNHC